MGRPFAVATHSKQPSGIVLSEPYPLLDPGVYLARCSEATFAWARQFKKWMARLALEPQNYQGRPYSGRLCKFLGLGTNPDGPFAGPQSTFRRLYVEVNGGQPTNPEAMMAIFEGPLYEIVVETVTNDRNGKERRPEHWYSIVREIHVAAPTLQHSNNLPSNRSTLRTQTTLTTDQHSNTENLPLTVSMKEKALGSKSAVRQ